eukprot:TRINITY_DN12191_c0_g1_i11.p1 TRINITY_DN12191_c0_g1~~TRINITY_DN12191_c0_g1_i11.p1  ORF type:complete len:162 (+),score=38.59 TRINITY_DN12191_c0_g1_i11:580-1065(+)
MIEVGKTRAEKLTLPASSNARQKPVDLKWEVGNAEDLKEPDSFFDFYTVAFGIRNVADREKALKEAHRVLRPGGMFVCLEMSKVQQPVFREVYDWYLHYLVPALGALTTKKEEYKYLAESTKTFPDQERFRKMILEAGFTVCSYRNYSSGVVALHQAWKGT